MYMLPGMPWFFYFKLTFFYMSMPVNAMSVACLGGGGVVQPPSKPSPGEAK
jgi:hypothetical protein